MVATHESFCLGAAVLVHNACSQNFTSGPMGVCWHSLSQNHHGMPSETTAAHFSVLCDLNAPFKVVDSNLSVQIMMM